MTTLLVLNKRPLHAPDSDAVLPLTYEGCDSTEPNGLCVLDTVLAALIKRGSEIDFDYDCNGNCA